MGRSSMHFDWLGANGYVRAGTGWRGWVSEVGRTIVHAPSEHPNARKTVRTEPVEVRTVLPER